MIVNLKAPFQTLEISDYLGQWSKKIKENNKKKNKGKHLLNYLSTLGLGSLALPHPMLVTCLSLWKICTSVFLQYLNMALNNLEIAKETEKLANFLESIIPQKAWSRRQWWISCIFCQCHKERLWAGRSQGKCGLTHNL